MVELGSCSSDSIIYKGENIFYLVLYRKCLLAPALSHGQQEPELEQFQINRKHLVLYGWVATHTVPVGILLIVKEMPKAGSEV